MSVIEINSIQAFANGGVLQKNISNVFVAKGTETTDDYVVIAKLPGQRILKSVKSGGVVTQTPNLVLLKDDVVVATIKENASVNAETELLTLQQRNLSLNEIVGSNNEEYKLAYKIKSTITADQVIYTEIKYIDNV